jgi:hypothetical protein
MFPLSGCRWNQEFRPNDGTHLSNRNVSSHNCKRTVHADAQNTRNINTYTYIILNLSIPRIFKSMYTFIVPINCTFLISTNIKWASPPYFGRSVPSSGGKWCQFLENQMLLQSCYLQVPWFVASLGTTWRWYTCTEKCWRSPFNVCTN